MPIHSVPHTVQFNMPMGSMKKKGNFQKKYNTDFAKKTAEPAAEPVEPVNPVKPKKPKPAQPALGPGKQRPAIASTGRGRQAQLMRGTGITNRQRVFQTSRDGAQSIGYATPGRAITSGPAVEPRQRSRPEERVGFVNNEKPKPQTPPNTERPRQPRTPKPQPAYPTHYATLGIKEGASSAEISHAFRKLSRQFHPDRFAGAATPQQKAAATKAKARYAGITEAYNALKTRRV